MRTTLALVIGSCASLASGQLINGDFEDGFNGWVYDPFHESSGVWSITEIIPSGGGSGSALALPAIHWSAAAENWAFQILEVPEISSAYRIGGWMGSPDPQFGMPSINLCRCDSGGVTGWYSPSILQLSQPGSWQHYDTLIFIDTPPPSGESLCLVLGSGDTDFSSNALFDDLFVELDLSTSIGPAPTSSIPFFRPNPATDRLWIDLPETPTSLIAIDASGRAYDLRNFTHRDRTLELDVSSIPAGLCVIRLNTPSGVRTLRFVKA